MKINDDIGVKESVYFHFGLYILSLKGWSDSTIRFDRSCDVREWWLRYRDEICLGMDVGIDIMIGCIGERAPKMMVSFVG